ncbi:MAG: hypothetical protein JHD16_04005 [Solirubrobacteraceae bacterium]|nr:hypothetical protein [Solirubrobacteraceae bacterium]
MLQLDALTPYRRLVDLAETECALVQAGHFDELGRLQAEWAEARGLLPSKPPIGAEPLLRRALALAAQSEAELRAGMAEIQRELGQVGRSRSVGRAYSPAAGGPVQGRIDTAA